jgi:hypothetical protein
VIKECISAREGVEAGAIEVLAGQAKRMGERSLTDIHFQQLLSVPVWLQMSSAWGMSQGEGSGKSYLGSSILGTHMRDMDAANPQWKPIKACERICAHATIRLYTNHLPQLSPRPTTIVAIGQKSQILPIVIRQPSPL